MKTIYYAWEREITRIDISDKLMSTAIKTAYFLEGASMSRAYQQSYSSKLIVPQRHIIGHDLAVPDLNDVHVWIEKQYGDKKDQDGRSVKVDLRFFDGKPEKDVEVNEYSLIDGKDLRDISIVYANIDFFLGSQLINHKISDFSRIESSHWKAIAEQIKLYANNKAEEVAPVGQPHYKNLASTAEDFLQKKISLDEFIQTLQGK